MMAKKLARPIPNTTQPATELRNLYHASRLTLPGLGLEGELATALAVSGSIAAPSRGRGRPRIFGR